MNNREKAEKYLDSADAESGEQWDVMMGIGYAMLALVDALSESPAGEVQVVEGRESGEDIP